MIAKSGSRLAVVAWAVEPGPGGPEAQVNADFLRALVGSWPGEVSVISGGEMPRLMDGSPLGLLPGWRVQALGEAGAGWPEASVWNRMAAWGVQRTREGGAGSWPVRALERLAYGVTGSGLKLSSWQSAAARALERDLGKYGPAVVYSRALPFASIAAAKAAGTRPGCRWIVNLNDPFPADVWPGLYPVDERAAERTRTRFRRLLPRIAAFTFPSRRLRDLELAAFPEMAAVPSAILPHVAPEPSRGVQPQRDPSRLRIAFAGTLRGNRARPELREGLKIFLEQDPEAARNLRFSFHLARATPAAETFLADFPVETEVTVGELDVVLHRALARADVLLDLESEPDAPLLLTKIAHSLAARLPIWALCARGGTTWSLVEERGWGYASPLGHPGGPGEVALTLRRIVADWRNGTLREREPSPALLERFSARRQVEDLLRLVQRIGKPSLVGEEWP